MDTLVLTIASDSLQLLAALVAASLCARTARHARSAATWWWLALFCLSWGLGQAVWTWYEVVAGVAAPYPSFADVGFLGAVPFGVAALLAAPRAPTATRARLLLDGACTASALLFCAWALLIDPADIASSHPAEIVLALAYPLADVVMLTVVGLVLPHATGRSRVNLRLVGMGIAAVAVADILFAWSATGGTYATGSWADLGWIVGFGLLGAAAVHAGRRHDVVAEIDDVASSRLRVTMAYLPCALAIAVGVYVRLTDGRFSQVLTLLAAGVFVLLLARQAMFVFELHSREQLLHDLATRDPLTGLANRAKVLARLAAAAERNPEHVGVLYVDLDGFKLVNDGFGHATGDALLAQVAARLRSVIRPGDVVGRLGGDEFVVCCENIADEAALLDYAEAVRSSVTGEYTVEACNFWIGASVGVALNTPGMPVERLVGAADAAMYAAKSSGGGQVVVPTGTGSDAARHRVEMLRDLRAAVGTGSLQVLYQPIVRLLDSTAVGMEALVRWHHPSGEVLLPDAFISLAESSGLIVDVGRWVLDDAIRNAVRWNAGGVHVPVSVNVSARQLGDPQLTTTVRDALARYGAAPKLLTLEVTESSIMEDLDHGVEVLEELSAMGVRIAVDDFGTGFSSLSYLKRFPVSVLKIDRSLIDGLGTSAEDSAIVEAVCALGSALRLDVVAEGIETEQQRRKLLQLSCRVGQGFLFSKPVAADLASEYVRRARAVR